MQTEYVVDSVEELSKVLMAVEKKPEKNKAGDSAAQTTYFTYFYYGNGLSEQENEKEGYLTYHFNNVGSTNAVTDEKGVVKYIYAYNPYGELTKGSYAQVMFLFLFNGQYGVTSDDNGLYYMRARYYNVSIKRFINQDVVTGSIAESQSLNRYAYVEGNPVSYLDPFGLEPLLTDGLHDFAATMSFIGSIVSFFEPTLGLLIGIAAYFFDLGVYINDIVTSGYDLGVICNAICNLIYNGYYLGIGFMSYAHKFEAAINASVGDMATWTSIISYCIDKMQQIIKEDRESGKSKK
ncbi:MAG: RHS repeat-associated core domain-containing protein [Lachnospiraceae bacterium]|nr:RHS repeat-associated core domain-containing protein [Lachnospiraceae bacterium]